MIYSSQAPPRGAGISSGRGGTWWDLVSTHWISVSYIFLWFLDVSCLRFTCFLRHGHINCAQRVQNDYDFARFTSGWKMPKGRQCRERQTSLYQFFGKIKRNSMRQEHVDSKDCQGFLPEKWKHLLLVAVILTVSSHLSISSHHRMELWIQTRGSGLNYFNVDFKFDFHHPFL